MYKRQTVYSKISSRIVCLSISTFGVISQKVLSLSHINSMMSIAVLARSLVICAQRVDFADGRSPNAFADFFSGRTAQPKKNERSRAQFPRKIAIWCGWLDLNQHARRHMLLRHTCIPISPHPHKLLSYDSFASFRTCSAWHVCVYTIICVSRSHYIRMDTVTIVTDTYKKWKLSPLMVYWW